jgi:hypothetical protein
MIQCKYKEFSDKNFVRMIREQILFLKFHILILNINLRQIKKHIKTQGGSNER